VYLKITNRFYFHCKSIYMTAKILNFKSKISKCKHTLHMSTQNSWFKFVYIRESVPRMLLLIITFCKKPLMADFRNFQSTTHIHKFISRKWGYFSTKISSKSMCIAILCIFMSSHVNPKNKSFTKIWKNSNAGKLWSWNIRFESCRRRQCRTECNYILDTRV
jgi:hypothetical protein